MMTIGVLSDTHLPKKAKELPDLVRERLRAADHIVHAGDLTAHFVLAELKQWAPVSAVAGNVDPPELAAELGWTKVLQVGRFRIGITHGHLGKGKTTPDRAWNTFQDEVVDMIVFGHSHIPFEAKRNGILLLNPGSPTDKRRQPQYSFCMLHVNHEIQIKWVRF